MSKSSDNFQSHGVYNWLITLVVDYFICQSQKKVILGRTAAMPVPQSIEVPIIGSSRKAKIMPSNTSIRGINGVLNNEVVIDFRNIEEEEEAAEISASTSFGKLSSSINFPNYKNVFILSAADRVNLQWWSRPRTEEEEEEEEDEDEDEDEDEVDYKIRPI